MNLTVPVRVKQVLFTTYRILMTYQKIITSLIILASVSSCGLRKPAQQHALHPTDALATPLTVNLYKNLKRIPEKGIMFGQQDATLYGIGWKYDNDRSDVKSVSGDHPAVYGWEIGHIETSSPESLDAIQFDVMRKHILDAYNRGGLNTISWHCDNPVTGGNSWDVAQKGVVTAILPGGPKHQLFMNWLDKVAVFLNSLETKDGKKIPILFRPFHEHTGNWFWWGENHCTPEEYIQLFKMTVDYFKEKGLHHLLYIYSPDQTDQTARYFQRYPGDDYIDILGVDFYHHNGLEGAPQYMETTGKILDMLTAESKKRNKPIAFSETGSEALPMSNWWTDVLLKTISPYPISYVLVWRNAYERPNHFFGPYPGQASSENFKLFKADKRTLFQSDIHNIYK